MKLRYYILALLLLFGLTPLLLAVTINLPLVVERTGMFYQKAYLQNLRADFRDLDQHLASRDEIIRLLAKLPDLEVILGLQGDEDTIDLARARYTGWINRMLADQGDIIQMLFLDAQGQARFWLERQARDRQWHPSETPLEPPSQGFIKAAGKLQPGEVMVSRIRLNPDVTREDPRQLLTLQLASPIGETPLGLLMMTIDVGGLAQFYRNTLWARHSGSYLQPGQPLSDSPQAFADFPGLEHLFAEGKLALAKSIHGEPYLWVPMFLTEEGVPLWVGRPVDSSPIADFRNTLIVRVLSIVLVLVVVVMVMARAIARRAERFGRELTAGVRQILREGQPLHLPWRGPYEVRELAEQLGALSLAHVEHLASERQHTRELEQSNRYKSEFLANVSHELRTPLNAILLLSKLLADRESGLEGESRRQAQVIHEASRDLSAMIDNILDISRIEAGQTTVSLAWVELPVMLRELLTLTEAMFTSKGLTLDVDIAPNLPSHIYSDRDKVRQILKNFLSNAAKFTHQGRVLITAEAHRDTHEPVALSVSDTGIGIPPGKEDIIFEAFQQADGSTRRRYGGTGLGLSISRELAGLLGGRISVDSALGQGSRFTLHLPLSLNPEALEAVEILESHEAPVRTHVLPQDTTIGPILSRTETLEWSFNPAHLGAGWILVLERDVQTLFSLTARLDDLGLRVQTAADVDEALETLNDEPDCALLLLGALADPRQTCDSIARIRAESAFADLPVVIMGEPGDRAPQDYLGTGATAFFTKPLSVDELNRLLGCLFAPDTNTATSSPCPPVTKS